jgi:hypothetical protein
METPVLIDFQGMDANRDVRGTIVTHLVHFEERFSRITAGRVGSRRQATITTRAACTRSASGSHCRRAAKSILAHTAPNDERHSDLTFAINDAFKRARRQLQDQVRKLQGQVKHYDGAPIRD